MEPNDIAWLAGLVEGEGCIHISKRQNRKTASILLKIDMSDEDVIARAAKMLGTTYTTKRGYKRHYKDIYSLRVWGPKAAAWIADIYEQLGERRKGKALEALTVFATANTRALGDGLCRRGHPILEEHQVYRSNGKSWCKLCKNQRACEREVLKRVPASGRQPASNTGVAG